MSHFEIHQTLNGEFYFLLQAANGETIVQSEPYTTKQNCENGIDVLKTTPASTEIRDLT